MLTARKLDWTVGAILAACVVGWWVVAYSGSDSIKDVGGYLTVVLIFGVPSWLILFGAYLGVRKLVRRF